MSPILIAAIFVALVGFVLLLRPETLWRPFQKDKDAKLSKVLGAFLRLVGIGALALSVLIAQLV